MQFEIDRDHFLRSVNIADSIIQNKSTNPILSNCLFNVNNDELEIISTDNDIAIRTYVDISSSDKGSFITDGKRLSQILREFPKGVITAVVDENEDVFNIVIKSKEVKGQYKLLGNNSDNYPEIPFITSQNFIEINQASFKEMIKKVVYAASTDNIKPVFNGVLINSDVNNDLTIVSSDSKRLAMIMKNIASYADLKDGIIVPLKTINEVYKLLNAGICKFSLKDNQCFFTIGETEIISRLIDGQFPNYKQVIPKDFLSNVIINTKKLIESLKRVMILTTEPTYRVILNFSKDKLIIEAKTAELGEAYEEIPIEMDNDNEIKIGINSLFLMDTLKEIDSFAVKISITGQMSPLKLSPENDDNYVSVIMPIGIKNSD